MDPNVSEVSDAIDQMGSPEAVILGEVAEMGSEDLASLLTDKRTARQVPHLVDDLILWG